MVRDDYESCLRQKRSRINSFSSLERASICASLIIFELVLYIPLCVDGRNEVNKTADHQSRRIILILRWITALVTTHSACFKVVQWDITASPSGWKIPSLSIDTIMSRVCLFSGDSRKMKVNFVVKVRSINIRCGEWKANRKKIRGRKYLSIVHPSCRFCSGCAALCMLKQRHY